MANAQDTVHWVALTLVDRNILFMSTADRACLERFDITEDHPLGWEFSSGGRVFGMALSPDGKMVAAALDGETVLVYNLYTDDATVNHFAEAATGLAFNPAGNTLALVGSNIQLWNVADRSNPRQLSTIGDPARAAAFSRDGRTLATVGTDGSVTIRDVSDRARPGKGTVLPAPGQGISTVAFSPTSAETAITQSQRPGMLRCAACW